MGYIFPMLNSAVKRPDRIYRRCEAMKLFFDDPEFDGQFQRAVGKTVYGMADVGECFVTAARITPGDYDSWYREWWTTAERIRQVADAARDSGHAVSAAGAYLRASEYYRSAYFFHRTDLSNNLLLAGWHAQRDCFRTAMKLREPACEIVEIPYQNSTLDGYFFWAPSGGERPATVISPSGYDGQAEEWYFYTAVAAMRRGYNALIFDGPG
jgi:hypothetical protein